MNKELLDFIEYHKLDVNMFFDAKAKPVAHCKNEMEINNKLFAFNSTPCQNHGHTTRAISGHCVVCDTARIAFLLRHYKIGNIYIAGSIKGQIIKVGFSENIEKRNKSINVSKFGNFDDWVILFYGKVLNAGMVEQLTHSELKPYQNKIQFMNGSHLQESKELYRCSYSKAKETVLNVVENLNLNFIGAREDSKLVDHYSFRNLRGL